MVAIFSTTALIVDNLKLKQLFRSTNLRLIQYLSKSMFIIKLFKTVLKEITKGNY